MCPIKYYTHVRLQDDLRSIRYHLIKYALHYGIKPAARRFNTTPRTVRKWLKRHSEGLTDWLNDRRAIPRKRPSKIPEKERKLAILLKKQNPRWGALRVKSTYHLTISDKAIRKIWKEEGFDK